MGPDFYKVLGISPSASPDEIRTAYRDLVKTTHPDLFSSAADKARATERLTQINEAYAVLGDAEKRKAFDEERHRAATPRPARPAAKVYRRASPRPAATVFKRQRRSARQGLRWRLPTIRRKWIAYMIGVVILAYFSFSVGSQRQVATAWTLFEQTIIEPPLKNPRSTDADGKWHPVDSYDSKAHCAGGLKARAGRDEREGSKVVLDERHGTTAITVLVSSPAQNETQAPAPQLTKRIRNYECRETHFLRESWLQRKLKQLGLSS